MEGYNNELEKHVVNEVINFDSVIASDLSLLVKQPEQYNEVTTVEKRNVILSITGEKFNQWFDFLFKQTIF